MYSDDEQTPPHLEKVKQARIDEVTACEEQALFLELSEHLRDRRLRVQLKRLWSYALTPVHEVLDMGYTPFEFVTLFAPPRIQRFVVNWQGNYRQAAIDAGFVEDSAHQTGKRICRMPIVWAAIRERDYESLKGPILNLDDLRVLWSRDCDDPDLTPAERNKSRELLAKSYGAFVQKVEMPRNGSSDDSYEARLKRVLEAQKAQP